MATLLVEVKDFFRTVLNDLQLEQHVDVIILHLGDRCVAQGLDILDAHFVHQKY